MNDAASDRRLREELARSHQQAARPGAEGFPLEALDAVQEFQRERLARTYADLSKQERYREAVAFFLDELYGGRGASDRDRQVEAALPIMEKTLPGRLQAALADAFRLQALSLELDIELALALARLDADGMDTACYVELYDTVPRARREEQIALIHRLALALDRAVSLPLVKGLVRAMRGPARALGFSALQQFLEEGLRAFRAMRGARAFADTVRDRELRIMERLYAGETAPFDLSMRGEDRAAGNGSSEV